MFHHHFEGKNIWITRILKTKWEKAFSYCSSHIAVIVSGLNNPDTCIFFVYADSLYAPREVWSILAATQTTTLQFSNCIFIMLYVGNRNKNMLYVSSSKCNYTCWCSNIPLRSDTPRLGGLHWAISQMQDICVADTNMLVSKKPTQNLADPTQSLADPMQRSADQAQSFADRAQSLVDPAWASGI